MIKVIITDVDGVIVGKQPGVNFPLPNKVIIQALRDLHKKRLPIVLCTAKFNLAVQEIVKQAELRNPHITDGGALIIDPLANNIVKKHLFEKKLAQDIVVSLLEHEVYTECFGIEDYVLQKNQISEFTQKRISVLQKEHQAVESLVHHLIDFSVIKILAFTDKKQEEERIVQALKKFDEQINVVWSMHPALEPFNGCIITPKGVSKRTASLEVLEYLKISPEETLGIGDTLGDWNFMSLCGYVGVVGDNQELQEKAKTKGEGKYFFGSSVTNHGFLEITDYFL